MSVKSVVEHLLRHGLPKDEETMKRLVRELHEEPALSVVKESGKAAKAEEEKR